MDNFEKIVTMVTASDRSVVRAGIALLQSLDEVTYYDQLLEGLSPSALSKGVLEKRSLSNRYFTLNREKQRSLLDVLASAPPTCVPAEALRQAVTAIANCDYLPESLSMFPNLRSLSLQESDTVTDLSAVKDVSTLEHVKLHSCSVLSNVSVLNELPCLKTIEINRCSRLDSLQLSGLPLKKIELRICSSMRTITMTDCSELDILKLWDLHGLSRISFMRNPKLSKVDLSDLPSLQDVEIDGGVVSLSLRSAKSLDSLRFLRDMVSLKTLQLRKLPRIRTLEPLRTLQELTSLEVAECDELTDVTAIESLSGLGNVDIRVCPKLKDIHSFSAVTGPAELHLNDMPMVDLSCLNQLRGFHTVVLSKLVNLTKLPPMEDLYSLVTLAIGHCENLVDISALPDLPGLTSLKISGIPEIADIAPVAGLNKLCHLQLYGCPNIRSVAPLSSLQELQSLEIKDCGITDLRPLLELTQLEQLVLVIDGKNVNYEVLTSLASLRSLNFARSSNVNLAKLRRMKLQMPKCVIDSESGNPVNPARSRPGTVVEFTSPAEARQFRKIRDLICSRSAENAWTGISLLKSIQNERIYQELLRDLSTTDGYYYYEKSYGRATHTNKYFSRSMESQLALFLLLSDAPKTCLEIQKIRDSITTIKHEMLPEDLSGFPNVRKLTTKATDAENLAAIAGLIKLTELELSGCKALHDIAVLKNFPGLERFALSGCKILTDLSPVAELPNLKTLSLSGFAQLSDLSPVAELPNLKTLSLSGFAQLSDISTLADLSRLTTLKLSGLDKVEELKGVEKASLLEELSISYCDALSQISCLGSSPSIVHLNVSTCKGIKQFLISDIGTLRTIKFSDSSWYDARGMESASVVLRDLPSLEKVTIDGKNILQIQFRNLDALTSLTLENVLPSVEIEEIGKLRNIKKLTLRGSIDDYSFLSNLPQLEELSLSGNVKLSAFEKIRDASVQTLNLKDAELSLADAREIKKILPDCKIIAPTGRVTL